MKIAGICALIAHGLDIGAEQPLHRFQVRVWRVDHAPGVTSRHARPIPSSDVGWY
ncbi:hypothetical protein SAMN04488490_1021 [Marinobacter sp. LV10R510-11A]|nr:hypothetical protein SAMN04488490_1021 [Marinobacter sp. LV10R510-11A]